MATYKPSFVTGTTLLSSTALADGNSRTDNLNLATNEDYESNVQFQFDIGSGTPSGDMTVEMFYSVDAGSGIDTEPAYTMVVNFTATGNKKKTIAGVKGTFVQFKTSNDTGESCNVTIKYDRMKQVSA